MKIEDYLGHSLRARLAVLLFVQSARWQTRGRAPVAARNRPTRMLHEGVP